MQIQKGQRLKLEDIIPNDHVFTLQIVDNADFFTVQTPNEHSDEALYDLMMSEYPEWIKLAKQQGILS